MELIINGKSTTCPDQCTVQELLDALQIPLAGTAVARNETVVRKATFAETHLAPGDRIEIIHAVAGG